MGIEKVGQIGVPVQDLERASAFYQDVLGLSLLFRTDRVAFFECGGLRLLLSLPEKDEFAHASSIIYFQVEDLPAVYNEIATKGSRMWPRKSSKRKPGWPSLKIPKEIPSL